MGDYGSGVFLIIKSLIPVSESLRLLRRGPLYSSWSSIKSDQRNGVCSGEKKLLKSRYV